MTASLSVAKAPADGYTLLQNGVALSVNPSLYKQVPYDVTQDFVPVAFLVNAPMILVINPSFAATSLGEFMSRYKGSDALTYAHPGAGTMPHLAAELFRVRSGLKIRAVPYRGGAPALHDVIAGHVAHDDGDAARQDRDRYREGACAGLGRRGAPRHGAGDSDIRGGGTAAAGA